MIVGCRCGWKGDVLMLTQNRQCPRCSAAFEQMPPLRFVPWRNPKAAIAAELYIALERLEAPPELLSIVGSWGDTANDEEILRYLKDWNATGKVMDTPQ